jgi:hypothetical protein
VVQCLEASEMMEACHHDDIAELYELNVELEHVLVRTGVKALDRSYLAIVTDKRRGVLR